MCGVDETCSMSEPATFDPAGRIIPLPVRALFDIRLKPHHTMLLIFVSYQSERCKNGWFTISQGMLAKFFGKTRGAVSGPLSDLHSWGYIKKEEKFVGGFQQENHYRVILDADLDETYRRQIPDEGIDLFRWLGSPEISKNSGNPGDCGTVTQKTAISERDQLHLLENGGNLGDSGGVTGDSPRVTPPTVAQSPGKHGDSPRVTGDSGGVTIDKDSLFLLREGREGFKENGKDQDSLQNLDSEKGENLPLTLSSFTSILTETHQRLFPEADPLPAQTIARQAESYLVDQLPTGLVRMIVDLVFKRVQRNSGKISSVHVLTKTWKTIADRYRASPDAEWSVLMGTDDDDDRRLGFGKFCNFYPLAAGDIIDSDATWREFNAALNRGATVDHLVEQAGRYARTNKATDPLYVKKAANWLRDGAWKLAPCGAAPTCTLDELKGPGACTVPDHVDTWAAACALIAESVRLKSWCHGLICNGVMNDVVQLETTGPLEFDWLTNKLDGELATVFARTFRTRRFAVTVNRGISA
jgi:hypothetical protein